MNIVVCRQCLQLRLIPVSNALVCEGFTVLGSIPQTRQIRLDKSSVETLRTGICELIEIIIGKIMGSRILIELYKVSTGKHLRCFYHFFKKPGHGNALVIAFDLTA